MSTRNTNVKELLNDIYLISGVPFIISDIAGTIHYSFPETLQEVFSPHLFEFAINALKKHGIKDEVFLYFITEDLYCVLTYLDDNSFLLSIPLSMENHSSLPVNFMHNFTDSEHTSYFIDLFNHTRSCSSYHAARLANLVKNTYCLKSVGKTIIHAYGKRTVEEAPSLTNDFHVQLNEDKTFSNNPNLSLFYEKDTVSAIKKGDETGFLQAFHRPMNVSIGQMSSNPIQQQKYKCVIGLYVHSHAAIAGGMDPELALSLSNYYCMRLDTLNTTYEIDLLSAEAGLHYCKKVRESNGSLTHSTAVSVCCNYISQHLYESIQLKDLEKIAHMNRRSLTIHFKKEIGETIPSYILAKKMEEARYLLKYSEINISEVSSLLCFSSQSHFTQLFKKQYGITPKQYREKSNVSI